MAISALKCSANNERNEQDMHAQHRPLKDNETQRHMKHCVKSSLQWGKCVHNRRRK